MIQWSKDLGWGGWSAPVETVDFFFKVGDLRCQGGQGAVDFLDYAD
jgi:hypothetical protein